MSPATRRRPLPARVYWVRRGLVLAVALGMVFGIAHLLGGTDSESGGDTAQVVGAEAAADGTPPASEPLSTAGAKPGKGSKDRDKPKVTKTKTPLAEPSGPCAASDIVATPKVKGTAYAGFKVTFRILLTTLESPACTWRVSPSTLAVKLVSGSDRIWSSQDCPASIPTTEVVVRKDHPAKVDVSWRGRRSDSACSQIPAWALPGWYHVEAAAFGAEPTDAQFQLEWPVRKTITPTPKPEPEKKSHGKSDKPDSSEKKADEPSDDPSHD
jgi:hypothetical protein